MARIKFTGPDAGHDSPEMFPPAEVVETIPGDKTGGQDTSGKMRDLNQLGLPTQVQILHVSPPDANWRNDASTELQSYLPHQPANVSLSIPITTSCEARPMLPAGPITVRGVTNNSMGPHPMSSQLPNLGPGFATAGPSELQDATRTRVKPLQANLFPDNNVASDIGMKNQAQTIPAMPARSQSNNKVGASGTAGSKSSSRRTVRKNATPAPAQSGSTSSRNKRERLADGNSEDPGTGNDENQSNQEFNVLRAIIRHPQLVFHFASYLRVQELLSLYAISKEFHAMINTHLMTVILSQAIKKAPHSARIFPFRCYRKLCVSDPISSRNSAITGETRLVPSFRWLRMVFWRESVVNKILKLMAHDGVGLPKHCELVIKKLWFLMDIPDNGRRIGTIQNRRLWSDMDLFFATLFLIKLDVRFTHPISGVGRNGMRHLLMAQPSLTLLWKVLKRTALQDSHETLKAFVRWKYQPSPGEVDQYIFGVAPDEVGKLQYEGYGKGSSTVKLQRPDELILKECVRRGLDMQQHYFDMFNWQYKVPPAMRARQTRIKSAIHLQAAQRDKETEPKEGVTV